jgi:hypothetical protein
MRYYEEVVIERMIKGEPVWVLKSAVLMPRTLAETMGSGLYMSTSGNSNTIDHAMVFQTEAEAEEHALAYSRGVYSRSPQHDPEELKPSTFVERALTLLKLGISLKALTDDVVENCYLSPYFRLLKAMLVRQANVKWRIGMDTPFVLVADRYLDEGDEVSAAILRIG